MSMDKPLIKVDFGGEGRYKNGVLTINADPKMNADYTADVRAKARELEQWLDDPVDQISAFHILEHIPAVEIFPTLQYWKKFLKPTGRLLVVVPDLGVMLDDYFHELIDLEVLLSVIFNKTPYAERGQWDQHYWGWNRRTLTNDLIRAGYYSIEPFGDEIYPSHWTFDSPGMDQSSYWGKYRFPNLRLAAYDMKKDV